MTKGSSGETASPPEIPRPKFGSRLVEFRHKMYKRYAVHHKLMARSRKRQWELMALQDALEVRLEEAKRKGVVDSELMEMERELDEACRKEGMLSFYVRHQAFRMVPPCMGMFPSEDEPVMRVVYSELKPEEVKEAELEAERIEMRFESMDSYGRKMAGSSETSQLASMVEGMKIEGSEGVMEIAD